jgi:hypothetical protein
MKVFALELRALITIFRSIDQLFPLFDLINQNAAASPITLSDVFSSAGKVGNAPASNKACCFSIF